MPWFRSRRRRKEEVGFDATTTGAADGDGPMPPVSLANRLTVDWVQRGTDESSFVLSGAGAWLLLVALLRGASGEARYELEERVGASSEDAVVGLNDLVELVISAPGMSAALGIWTTPSAELLSDYVDDLPRLRVEPVPADSSVLDTWVREETNGLIESFPAELSADTLMVAATALVAQADWLQPFQEGSGFWRSEEEPIGWLSRRSNDLSVVEVLRSGPDDVGRVVCETTGAFDVHLLTADASMPPSQVLSVGIGALGDRSGIDVSNGASLKAGTEVGGLSVREAPTDTPHLRLSLPAFSVTSKWDLTSDPRLFGLASATDTSRGHFDRLSSFPLAVDSGVQLAMAGFSATGFRAAAVTAVLMVAGAAAPPETNKRIVLAHLNNPFGFLVVHRSSQLVLFAGWVDEPGNEQHGFESQGWPKGAG